MVGWLHEFIWGPGMLGLFLGVGLLYTIKLRGFPILGIRKWWKCTVGSLIRQEEAERRNHDGTNGFQSACTAMAATIGTGNIAGVAAALLAGGPGAVFWMWVSAFLGMATAYGETELGIRYRWKDRSGNWISGAMVYLERGIGCRWLAVLYAVFCILASFGMGCMVQANTISETISIAFSVPVLMIGVLLTVLSGRIILGGGRSIVRAAEKMVPVSAAIYLAAALMVIVLFGEQIPWVFKTVVRDACSFSSASGGILGFFVSKRVRYGVARGVFSNEAGLGSMAALNGGTDHAEPGMQGQWAIFAVFFDTIVCCTLTAVVILCAMGETIYDYRGNGAELVFRCFEAGLGNYGGYAVSVCLVLFAFATIIAWYYMGKQAVTYLEERLNIRLGRIYTCLYLMSVFGGSFGPMERVWELSDVFNGMMAIPNLLALILLARDVKGPESA